MIVRFEDKERWVYELFDYDIQLCYSIL